MRTFPRRPLMTFTWRVMLGCRAKFPLQWTILKWFKILDLPAKESFRWILSAWIAAREYKLTTVVLCKARMADLVTRILPEGLKIQYLLQPKFGEKRQWFKAIQPRIVKPCIYCINRKRKSYLMHRNKACPELKGTGVIHSATKNIEPSFIISFSGEPFLFNLAKTRPRRTPSYLLIN